MNNVTLIGRLCKNPEIKKTEEGRSICTFTLAIDDIHSKEDRTDFIRVTVFGNQGENCSKYLRKGFLTGVSGRFRSDTYKDSEGIVRYPIGIVAERVQFLQWPEKEAKKSEEVKESKEEIDEIREAQEEMDEVEEAQVNHESVQEGNDDMDVAKEEKEESA